MAVPAQRSLHEIPEFTGARTRSVYRRPRPAGNPRIARRPARRPVAARLLRSRALDNLCGIAVGAIGLFFAISVVRMLIAR